MRAHNTPEEKSGPGTGPAPSSSKRTATSVSELPVPPYCSGIAMPAQPSPASLLQRSAAILAGSLSSFTSVSRPHALRTKSRADSWMSFWVESSERSIAYFRQGSWVRGQACQNPSGARRVQDGQGPCETPDALRLTPDGLPPSSFILAFEGAGLLPLRPADADAPGHDDALNVGRRARVQRGDRVALEIFHRALERPPALVLREHV